MKRATLSLIFLLVSGTLSSPPCHPSANLPALNTSFLPANTNHDSSSPPLIRKPQTKSKPKANPASTQPQTHIQNQRRTTCYFSPETHGCSKLWGRGYCWKVCGLPGLGTWCWTAHDLGLGDWIACTKDEECSRLQACGVGDCMECGCGC